MSFSDRLSILERLPSHQRMTARDNAGKKSKKTKKTKQERHEHFQKDWDKDLWEQISQHCLYGTMGYTYSSHMLCLRGCNRIRLGEDGSIGTVQNKLIANNDDYIAVGYVAIAAQS